MIDLHTHTHFSDGELVPAELVRCARAQGYEGLAITDHADSSNFDWIIPRIVGFCETLPKEDTFRVVPGIELTYVEPETISLLVRESRNLGARLVFDPRGLVPEEGALSGHLKPGGAAFRRWKRTEAWLLKSSDRVVAVSDALSAHEGEMARADHRVHVDARSRLTAITAAEKVFGFGAPALAAGRAEVVTEVVRRDGRWLLGAPRALDAANPLGRPTSRQVDAWLDAPSPRDLAGGPYD